MTGNWNCQKLLLSVVKNVYFYQKLILLAVKNLCFCPNGIKISIKTRVNYNCYKKM